MRAMVVHPGFSWSVHDVYTGWCEGLTELGVEVVEFNMQDRLTVYRNAHMEIDGECKRIFEEHQARRVASQGIEAQALEFWPDIVLIISAFFIDPFVMDVLRARDMKVVILHTESPYMDTAQLKQAAHADFNLTNDPTNLERFRKLGPAEYQHHCYRPSVHHPRPASPELVSDFCFVGSGYPSRVKFFEAVDWSGIDVALAGNWAFGENSPLRSLIAGEGEWGFDNKKAADLYASTKMSMNLYRREADADDHASGWACSPREVELAAMGVPFLTEAWGENQDLLPFLPTFEGPEDFGRKLRYWLDHPDLKALGEQAREAVKDRTFTKAAENLLNRLAA